MQTAYLKLVDCWLFFGLIIPFLAFVLEVSKELANEEHNRSDNVIGVVSSFHLMEGANLTLRNFKYR